jgi:branched-chain amino acid transport system substrate-binding protein
VGRKLFLAALALSAALAAGLPAALASSKASASRSADPGVTGTLIRIGGTFPLSGPASRYAAIPLGMKAYFSYINARPGPDGKRGVYGRQISFKFLDDASNPARALPLTRQLVERDKVFAIVGTFGTEQNLAIRDYLNQQKVPHTLVSAGARTWGRDYRQFPYTSGWQPDHVSEGSIYGRHIVETRPNAKIGILYENDDYGRDYVEGLELGLGSKKDLIVDRQAVEATAIDARPELARLRSAGADTFLIFTRPTIALDSFVTANALGWRPQIYLSSIAAMDASLETARQRAPEAVNGTISTTYLKDPASPAWDIDPGMRLFKRLMARYYPKGSTKDQLLLYGMAKAHTFVELLEAAGRNPTRRSLLSAVQQLNAANPFLLPGIRVKTSTTDRFPIEEQKLVRYQDGSWREFGELRSGRTAER